MGMLNCRFALFFHHLTIFRRSYKLPVRCCISKSSVPIRVFPHNINFEYVSYQLVAILKPIKVLSSACNETSDIFFVFFQFCLFNNNKYIIKIVQRAQNRKLSDSDINNKKSAIFHRKSGFLACIVV